MAAKGSKARATSQGPASVTRRRHGPRRIDVEGIRCVWNLTGESLSIRKDRLLGQRGVGMSQTTIDGWWPAAPWLSAVLAAAPVLWAWWKQNDFGRMIVARTIWSGLVWLEVSLIGAPRLPGVSVIHVNHLPKIVSVDGRHFSATSVIAFGLMFCIDGWIAWNVSKLPRYLHAWQAPRRPWYLDVYENFARRL